MAPDTAACEIGYVGKGLLQGDASLAFRFPNGNSFLIGVDALNSLLQQAGGNLTQSLADDQAWFINLSPLLKQRLRWPDNVFRLDSLTEVEIARLLTGLQDIVSQ